MSAIDQLHNLVTEQIETAEGEARRLRIKLDAAEAILTYRERELLELKGPCSNGMCRLHCAHSGPCDTRPTR